MSITKEKTLAVEVAHEAYRAAGSALRAAKAAVAALDASSTTVERQAAFAARAQAQTNSDNAGMRLETLMISLPATGKTEGGHLDE